MIKIITDSTSYIPESERLKYDISVISLGVSLNHDIIREVDIENQTFYEAMANAPEIPSSSQPTPEEMYLAFEKQVQLGHSVLGIFISSEMSGTYASSHTIKAMILEKYPDAEIELLDSRSNCMQLGFMALVAAKVATEDKNMHEVIAAATHVRDHSRFLFTPDTLTYLKKGGRIGGASALFGTLLQIKPILTVENGMTSVFAKVRTKKKAIATLINGLMNDLKSETLGHVIVHHINAPEEGMALAKQLEKVLNRSVSIQSIGPVIGVHVGPGSIGLAYYTV